MYAKYEQYINTAIEGSIILVEHNLKSSMPSIFLYEPVGLSDKKIVSLYDSRIESIETKGVNVIQITFSLPFEGYVNLIDLKNNTPAFETRLARLEDLTSLILQQQKNLVSNSQWREMNTLNLQEISEIDSALKNLKKDLENLKSDVESIN